MGFFYMMNPKKKEEEKGGLVPGGCVQTAGGFCLLCCIGTRGATL